MKRFWTYSTNWFSWVNWWEWNFGLQRIMSACIRRCKFLISSRQINTLGGDYFKKLLLRLKFLFIRCLSGVPDLLSCTFSNLSTSFQSLFFLVIFSCNSCMGRFIGLFLSLFIFTLSTCVKYFIEILYFGRIFRGIFSCYRISKLISLIHLLIL